MTYPPQQSGPNWPNPSGQQPGRFGPGPYFHQPGQPGYPSGYGYPGGGPPPKRRNSSMVVAIVVIAVLVLGGAVAATIVLTSGDDKQTSAPDDSPDKREPAAAGAEPTRDGEEPADDNGGSTGGEEDVLAAAQQYVDAIGDRDEAAATELTCDTAGPGSLYELADNADWEIELTGEVTIVSDGFANVEIKMSSSYGNESTAPGLLMDDEDGWCVSV
ncbi:MAG: hypothetical protein GEV28_34755 [Actinophytocola sp.]|uniref:hypothetical protein n=1 Tax=Actinophytocola sp. TaxID=1872138 RepID=UPI001323B83A|nr:hypothetical protein [Actinophytocola sp.]MPZ85272.1 hypothetical protein [Actinophytocola sp.]